jgi:hypothetical protein
MMRIGIEVSRSNLRCDLLIHPERYFFILLADSSASLCIQTCDAEGKNIQNHILDGFSLGDDGQLYSIFADLINDAIYELQDPGTGSFPGNEYPLSYHLVQRISKMPDLVDWLITSILSDEKNLIIFSANLYL